MLKLYKRILINMINYNYLFLDRIESLRRSDPGQSWAGRRYKEIETIEISWTKRRDKGELAIQTEDLWKISR